MKHQLDWSAYENYGEGDAYAAIPAGGGAYGRAVAVCIGNRQCQRNEAGVMCPSYRATGEALHSTRERAVALRAALNGEYGEAGLHSPQLAQALELCVGCKGCKRECPNGVDMAALRTEVLAQKAARFGVARRERLFAELPRLLHRHRGLLRLAALRNALPLARRLGERWLGLAAARSLPVPAPRAFTAVAMQPPGEVVREVVLLVDTFSRHYDPEIAEAACTVLAAGGYKVFLAEPAASDAEPERPLCCGRTYLSSGLIDRARAEAQRMLTALAPHLEAGRPVIGLEPSCLYTLRDEFLALGLGERAGQLARNALLFEEFLAKEHDAKRLKLPLKALPGPKALVHGHCHQKAYGAMKLVRKVLGLIPEFQFELVESSCCGMAGSFGLEAEHHEVSQRMAELTLLPALRAAPEARVLADGFSCRHQIRDGCGRPAQHVALLLREALS